MEPKKKLNSSQLDEMIAEELSQPQLAQDVDRTLHNCDEMLHCFAAWRNLDQISNKQRKMLYSALDSTLDHLDHLLGQIEFKSYAIRSTKGPSIGGEWSEMRKVLLKKRRSLKSIFDRL